MLFEEMHFGFFQSLFRNQLFAIKNNVEYGMSGDLMGMYNVKVEQFPHFYRVTACTERKFSFWCDRPVADPVNDELAAVSAESRLCAVTRAKRRIFDLINLNSWDWFVTLTVSGELCDRYNAQQISRKLSVYLRNQVQRSGIAYLLIPEQHKDGAYHAHVLIRGDLKVVDSGTVTWKGQKKPVKRSTAQRMGVKFECLQTVYNVPSWKLGYSTAIRTYGDGQELAYYVGKYITKGNDKIFGRYYWHSQNIKQWPEVYLCRSPDFTSMPGIEYKSPVGHEKYKLLIVKDVEGMKESC